MVAYITMLCDGGTKSPSHDEVIVTAVEKSASYPWSTIIGISIEPREAVSAEAEPEIPPKKYDATIFTIAIPPRIQPTQAFASAISFSEIPPLPIKQPIVIKKGTAISENDDIPLTIC